MKVAPAAMIGDARLENPTPAIAANAETSASHPAPGKTGCCWSRHTPSAKPNAANLIASRQRFPFAINGQGSRRLIC